MIDSRPVCFIDMDGVLCDFVGAVCRVFGRSELLRVWPAGEYRCEVVFGVTQAEFWKRIEIWPGFWLYLEQYDWAPRLVNTVKELGYRPVIATAPSQDPICAAHKTQWLQNHFGKGGIDYFMGRDKHLLAQPGRVLIDDNDANCEQFAAAGGTSLLFPQRWNSGHQIEDGIGDVIGRLKVLAHATEKPAAGGTATSGDYHL